MHITLLQYSPKGLEEGQVQMIKWIGGWCEFTEWYGIPK